MWKDFFYFNKGQRTGILVLITLILLALIANYIMPIFFPVTQKDGSAFLSEVEKFKKSLVSRDSIQLAEWQRKSDERQRQYKQNYKPFPEKIKEDTYSLFTFDPNTVDSTTFVRLGLKPFIVANILKYRKAGGRFKTKEDFGRVYGILPNKFKELEPYITIAEIKPVKVEKLASEKRTDIIVDLNSADTTLLMQVKGIGRGYAKGIVRFRQQTGGFVSVNQLSEIYGMRPENLERIRPFCKVNTDLVQKIKVNIATAERFKSHPYFNFYQAKALYELRRRKGKLKDITELKELQEFSPEVIQKLKPYLSFE
jgi:DNA uptake protein ComE-like DNA-binding protein